MIVFPVQFTLLPLPVSCILLILLFSRGLMMIILAAETLSLRLRPIRGPTSKGREREGKGGERKGGEELVSPT